MTWTIEQAVKQFGDALVDMGFDRVDDRRFLGTPLQYPGTDGRPTLEIHLPDGFPYRQPDVFVLEPEYTARSWHLNLHDDGRGRLCLYGHNGSYSDYPWSDPVALVNRIGEWFDEDSQGWPNEPPVLDINAYLPRSPDQLLVTPSHLESSTHSAPLTIRRLSDPTRFWMWETRRDPQLPAEASSWLDEPVTAVYVDVGAIQAPPRTIRSLLDTAPMEAQDRIDRVLEDEGVVAIIARYSRGGSSGVLGLHASRYAGSDSYTAFWETSELAPEILTLRSGAQADLLARTAIAVVGVGAIGSFLIDGLVRAGARRIDLYDSDTLSPGNCVRHLCGLAQVGLSKGEAVRRLLLARGSVDADNLTVAAGVKTFADAHEIVTSHALTIDATASETASGLLIHAAEAAGRNLLSVCILGDGEYIRVDRWPLSDTEVHDPAPLLTRSDAAPLYEAGCGDPVSPTPPYVPQLAAALAAQCAVRVLTGSPVGPTRMERM